MQRTAVEPREAADKKYKKSMGPATEGDETQRRDLKQNVLKAPSNAQRLPFCVKKVRRKINAARKQNAAQDPYLNRRMSTLKQYPSCSRRLRAVYISSLSCV